MRSPHKPRNPRKSNNRSRYARSSNKPRPPHSIIHKPRPPHNNNNKSGSDDTDDEIDDVPVQAPSGSRLRSTRDSVAVTHTDAQQLARLRMMARTSNMSTATLGRDDSPERHKCLHCLLDCCDLMAMLFCCCSCKCMRKRRKRVRFQNSTVLRSKLKDTCGGRNSFS